MVPLPQAGICRCLGSDKHNGSTTSALRCPANHFPTTTTPLLAATKIAMPTQAGIYPPCIAHAARVPRWNERPVRESVPGGARHRGKRRSGQIAAGVCVPLSRSRGKNRILLSCYILYYRTTEYRSYDACILRRRGAAACVWRRHASLSNRY